MAYQCGGDPQRAVAVVTHDLVPPTVVRRHAWLFMVCTIDLDNQPGVVAEEIDSIAV